MSEHLMWSGCDTVELARNFGTPLYVVSEEIIRARCAEIRTKFIDKWPNTRAYYAGKAFLTMTMARIIQAEGLGLDLVSGGEVYTAYKSGFLMEKTLLHGSSKSDAEITEAIRCGVGRIVVDSIPELYQINELAQKVGIKARVLIRVAPGVRAHTHSAIQTAHYGGKFGLSGFDSVKEATRIAIESRYLEPLGFHFHIGSQIYEIQPYVDALKVMAGYMEQLKNEIGFATKELDVGGGYGVAMSPADETPKVSFFTDTIMETLTTECEKRGMTRPVVIIEPGRWIISEAGVTLYSVENVKHSGDVIWVNVNGGMADNPRPCLYGAKYYATVANKLNEPKCNVVSIAGHCCESGDTLIESIEIQKPERGDIIALFSTGAYTFSMASNYNRMLRPAVVLVNNKNADIIVERQTYEDLLRGEKIPARLGTASSRNGMPV